MSDSENTKQLGVLVKARSLALQRASSSLVRRTILDLKRLTTDHPRALCGKELQFIESIAPIFAQMNMYITKIDVLFDATNRVITPDVLRDIMNGAAGVCIRDAAQDTDCLYAFEELLLEYNLCLPSELLVRLKSLLTECKSLSSHPSPEKAVDTIQLLFETQDVVRQSLVTCMGYDNRAQAFLRRWDNTIEHCLEL